MKSYLALARIQAKAHRRTNRMTIFCIALSVFLITGVFSMAEMEVRNESVRMAEKHGYFHIVLLHPTENEAAAVGADARVRTICPYDVANYHLEKDYTILGKKVILMASDSALQDMYDLAREGQLPREENEIALSFNAREIFDYEIGDKAVIRTPAGEFSYTVTGFIRGSSFMAAEDSVGALMTMDAFRTFNDANGEECRPQLFVRFRDTVNIRRAIDSLMSENGWTSDDVGENTAVLALMGISTDNYIVGLYGIASLLGVLVVLSGVLMISGSMSGSIAERTRYFGMLRCIGAGKRQIRRLVRREALRWCIPAIPMGELAAVVCVWGICAGMRYAIGGEWGSMPLFAVSGVGLLSGVVIGIFTVLLSARSPAKKAASVPPVTAVSGDHTGLGEPAGHIRSQRIPVECSLGIHHATERKKSWLLMTGSFALSIVLFLSFSVMIDWVDHALTSLRPDAPDVSLYSEGYGSVLPTAMAEELLAVPGVERVYGRMYREIPVTSEKSVTGVDLITYEAQQFDWAKKDLLRGDLSEVRNGTGAMTVFEKNNPLTLGDVLDLGGTPVKIVAVLSDSPFGTSDVPGVIVSEELFTALTGEKNYAVVDIQLAGEARDETVRAIRGIAGEGLTVSDRRDSNKETHDTYLAFVLLVYGFLGMVALITVFNILNSISMSAAARTRQYGIMRSLGMERDQLRRMILSESVTYAVSGCTVGCLAGLPLNALFHGMIIGRYWGDGWIVPWARLGIILAVVIFSSVLAAGRPYRRIVSRSLRTVLNGE